MKTLVEYNCKFCHRAGAVEVEHVEDLNVQIEKFKPSLCCNRCGDFHAQRVLLFDRIYHAAIFLIAARQSKNRNEIKKAESASLEKFAFLTRKFADLVCDHLLLESIWSDELPAMMMEKPKYWRKILVDYMAHTKRIKESM